MKHSRYLMLLLGLSFALILKATVFTVDNSSARMYIEMARNAQHGKMPGDSAWTALFDTPAYKNIIRHSGSNPNEFTSNIRRAFEKNYETDIMDGAVAALVTNMKEGVADILNKKHMPTESLPPYGKGILDIYNADYLRSPAVLEELDSVTCAFLDEKIEADEYFERAFACARFGGHTTGDFMVFLIRDRLGLDAVVQSVGDIDAFIDNYNTAARKAGTYVFSNRFTDHIHSVSQPAKKKM